MASIVTPLSLLQTLTLVLLCFLGLIHPVPAQSETSTDYFDSATSVSPTPITTTPPPSPVSSADVASTATRFSAPPWGFCPTEQNVGVIDLPIATALADEYCYDLVNGPNFPPQGASFVGAKYPTDLIIGDPRNLTVLNSSSVTANYTSRQLTAIELSGLIATFKFQRNLNATDGNNDTTVSGTDADCDLDMHGQACYARLHKAIDYCQGNFDGAGLGGSAWWYTACGVYMITVTNCSIDYDASCDRWHAKWPNLGVPEGQPYTTSIWNVTATSPTLTTFETQTLFVAGPTEVA